MAQVTALPANDFLNSLGINTHLGQGANEANYEPMFKYTGIRNTRDNLNGTAGLVTLHNNTIVSGSYPGVRANIHEGSVSALIASGTTLAAVGGLLSFEGPNEPNTRTWTYNGVTGGGHAFPAGLTVSTSTGVISGTTTAAATTAIAITAKNATGTGRATLTLIVNPVAGVPVINSAAQAAASNSAFSYNITASNSPTSYNATFLPPGLSVNTSTGLISGTATPTSGTWTSTLSAINASGTGTATLTITINATAGTPVITSAAAVTTTVGSAFSYSIVGTNTPTSYSGLASYVPVAQYQRDLFAAQNANSVVMNYPMFGVSEDGGENDNVGLQFLTIPAGSGCLFPDGTAFFDYANCHNYVDNGASFTDNKAWNGAEPSLAGGVDGMYGEYTNKTWSKGFTAYPTTNTTIPRVATETGWGTIGSGSLSESNQANVFLDVYLSQFKRGWSYTFIYEMKDGEGGDTTGEGVYHSDNTPKASATAIHNMTTILADTTSGTTGSMSYSIPSQPSTVHDLLLQKSNGTYYLIVWDEKFSTSGSDSVTVNLGATAANVDEYDPTIASTVQTNLTNVSSVALTLKDHPIILAISGLTTGGLPSPWAAQDIGSVTLSGTTTYTSGTFSVTASGGAFCSGTADSIQFVYQPVTGDCTITARESSLTGYHHSRAGVVIRGGLTANAQESATYWLPSSPTTYYGSRITVGGTGSSTLIGSASLPYWLRVQRSGSTFIHSVSSNGTSWTTTGTDTISMPSTVYVGMDNCTMNQTLGTANYDNVTVTTP